MKEEDNMKKKYKIMVMIISGLIVINITGLVITGWKIGWGPFSKLYSLSGEVAEIEKKYDVSVHQNGILFYGASNFRLWKEMEHDLSEYRVQNHGFGGSTDKMLMQYADRILYPYNPQIVFFQTGSNDYVEMSGSDEEKIKTCMEYKEKMFETFHEQLPKTKFVVMSGLLLPGRSEYTALTQQINEHLEQYCREKEYMYFVDASDMTYDGKKYAEELFISDKIHLNHEGQLKWCEEYIRPMIEKLETDKDS